MHDVLLRGPQPALGWRDTTLTYLELSGWKFWTMGAPIEETTIINRERLPAERLFERGEGR